MKIPDEGGRGTKQALHRNTSASTSYDNRHGDRKIWDATTVHATVHTTVHTLSWGWIGWDGVAPVGT